MADDAPTEMLPIEHRRDEIIAAIQRHQVVVVAGETGSGKSTKLPQFCLDAGRGVHAMVGHTQPRRLAARAVATRVAEEVGTRLGDKVGYTVRFTDEVGPTTQVRLMTDGILLADLARDPELSRYDTIIIDEAHERTLNIDFLLGYLHRLLPRRPDLRVIITSATIDTERIAAHFGDAPAIEVSGRLHPVEVRYRPLVEADDPESRGIDVVTGIERAVREAMAEQPGDVLVFLPGERDIHEARDHLNGCGLNDTEVIPLYARLSPAEQQRIFTEPPGRRIVLSTNVAETSLTVPRVHSVIDVGTARVSRFNQRTKVQRLPIEAISQASAAQRAGRCGRLGPGLCIRLYDEADFASRPEFTEPEIQRTNLASVVLQMASLGLGPVDEFPFLDPPEHRAVVDGVRLLEELDAIDPDKAGTPDWLTPLGHQLAELPIDPRLARMLLEADDHGAVRELLIITSGLSVQDPRIRPSGVGSGAAREAANTLHARFRTDDSDFMSMLALWEHLETERAARTGNGFRRMCRDEYLHFLRIREWQDVHRQLTRMVDRFGLALNDNAADVSAVHQSVLAGLLSHLGIHDPDKRDYRGARNSRFVLAPGSALGRRSPRWVMAAEMVETDQIRARRVAAIDPAWLERAASHLLRWSYSDPWWSPERGAALCEERATLYGLPVVAARPINLHRIDPELACQIFVERALVAGEWERTFDFQEHNRQVLLAVDDLEARYRRRDLRIDDDAIADLLAARLPDTIVSGAHFERWWKRPSTDRSCLDLTVADMLDPTVGPSDPDAFPDVWPWGADHFDLHYEFDPGSPTDGVTIDIPLTVVRRVDPRPFEWLVPGLREELITTLLRGLPKATRRSLQPMPETVADVLSRVDSTSGRLTEQVAAAVSHRLGRTVGGDELDLSALPAHLRPHFRVVDNGTAVTEDDDLDLLKQHLLDEARALLAASTHDIERTGLTTWDIGSIPSSTQSEGLGQTVQWWPALVDEGDTVALRLLSTSAEAHEAHWNGVRRLLLLNRPPVRDVLRTVLTNEAKFAIVSSPYSSPGSWFDDCLHAASDLIIGDSGRPPRDTEAWTALHETYRRRLPQVLLDTANHALDVLHSNRALQSRLEGMRTDALAYLRRDVGEQIARLVHDGFIAGLGSDRLADVDRFVRAAHWRVDRAAESQARDRDHTRTVRRLEAAHDQLVDRDGWTPELVDLGWLLQELRVSLFAQPIGAAAAVSPKKIRRALEEHGIEVEH